LVFRTLNITMEDEKSSPSPLGADGKQANNVKTEVVDDNVAPQQAKARPERTAGFGDYMVSV
jgi:hypothetical protein